MVIKPQLLKIIAMKTQFILTIASFAVTLLLGSCTKEQDPVFMNPAMASAKTANGILPTPNIPTTGLKPIALGSAGSFAILTQYGVRNPMPPSAVTGDLGVYPFHPESIHILCPQVKGNIYCVPGSGIRPCYTVNPSLLEIANRDMIDAYNSAANLPSPQFQNLDLANLKIKKLKAGLYKWTGSLTVPNNIILMGGPNDVWVFQVDGAMQVNPDIKITLGGGAQARNIFWQSKGVVTLGARSHIEGNILGKDFINLKQDASVNGRLFSHQIVNLERNVVTIPAGATIISVD
jgi:Ice-binding-like